MEVLRTISLYAESKNIGFMVIGGHALNYYGISRQTGDIDLVVRRSEKDQWHQLLSRLRYEVGQHDDRFGRFKPQFLGSWPIDLMFVDDPTFDKLVQQAEDGEIGIAEVKVVSARHLATMKIHALKHYQAHRAAKDYNDLVGLLRGGKTGLSRSELKELCVRYASEELFLRLAKDVAIEENGKT